MATSPDFTILASPRVSVPTFAGILSSGHSPAAPEAVTCYRAIAAYGVDPAVALAVFRKESTFGRFGKAAGNRSWGNIRNHDGSFRRYASWTAGAADVGRLLALYGSNQIRKGVKTDTVQTMPYVWAPSSDGNAPDAYGDSLARWIAQWSGQAGSAGSTGGTSSSPPAGQSTGFITPSDLADKLAALLHVGRDDLLTAEQAATAAKWLSDNGYYDEAEARTELTGNTLNAWAEHHRAGGPLDPIANAIAGVGAAIGDALIHFVILLGILALLGMGVWLIATSED